MVIVNEEKCVGCSQCVAFCPFEALEAWAVARIKYDECTECLECIDYCPVEALEVKE